MKKLAINKNYNLLSIIKALIYSIFTTLICILIFAFILNIFNLGDESINIVNQIIKIVSILIGCFVLNKSLKSGIVPYILLPLLYTVLTFIIFSALNKSFSLDITLFNDAFFGIITGSIYYFLLGRK